MTLYICWIGLRQMVIISIAYKALDCTCVPVECVCDVKYAGVVFGSDLSWNTQRASICKRMIRVSCLLCCIKVQMSIRIRIMQTLGCSILRYGITLFGNCLRWWHNRIDGIFKGILRSVAYNSEFFAEDNLFKSLHLPNFETLYYHQALLGQLL